MAIHVCRDFQTLGTAIAPLANAQFLTYFLSGVLGFKIIGTKNAAGASAKLALADLIFASGHSGSTGASLNIGLNKEYYLQVPTSSHVVVNGNVNRIIALRSFNFPRSNSGLFRITSQSIADNAYVIDYRTPGGNFPPIEPSGSLNWIMFQSESNSTHAEGVYADNGGAGNAYQTQGTATYPRMILQSPHSTSWQVRVCIEGADDRNNIGGLQVGNTVAVGLGGDANGDFQAAGPHTHGAQFYNDNEPNRRNGQQTGCDPICAGSMSWTTGQWRVLIWGDDQTGSVIFMNRGVSGANFRGMCLFGMPDNEPLPVPTLAQLRLFAIGDSNQNDPGNPTWNIATKNEYSYSGIALGVGGTPISCVMSSYHFMDTDAAPRAQVTGDNPILKATELIPVELLAGTWLTTYIRSTPFGQNLSLEPRRMGQVPMARQGRSNFGDWTLSTDANRSWFHATNGMFMPWGGPPVNP